MESEAIRRVGQEPPEAAAEQPVDNRIWWTTYKSSLVAAGLTATAIQVVDIDSEYIVSKGIFGVGEPKLPTLGGRQVAFGVG